MPAHKTAACVGVLEKASGKCVTTIDWRANNLADHLARQSAEATAPPMKVIRLVNTATEMVKCAAAKLGLVTWAANNHISPEVQPDGSVRNVTRRDACAPPAIRLPKKSKPAHNRLRGEEPADLPARLVRPESQHKRHQYVRRRIASKRAARAREEQRQEAALHSIISINEPPRSRRCGVKRPRKRPTPPVSSTAASVVAGAAAAAASASTEVQKQAAGEHSSTRRISTQPPACTRLPPLTNQQSAAITQSAPAVATCGGAMNSKQHEFFEGSDVRHHGEEMRTLAAGEDLDLLLELAYLEADGQPVRWPRGWSAAEALQLQQQQQLRVRASQ